MFWPRLLKLLLLLSAWAALAWSQYHEYVTERDLARQTLERQAATIRNAVVGGIRSHRRLGHFFPDQLQGLLDELARADDVLALAVTAADRSLTLSAGDLPRLDLETESAPQEAWEPQGFHLVSAFALPPDTGGPPGGPGGGPGPGAGRGFGRGKRWQAEAEGPFASGGQFRVHLLLDRAPADAQALRAARLRTLLALAGGLVLVFAAWVWRATVRLVEARGRAQVLEAEARHLRQLSQAAAGLAHETRNPLGLVRGWAQRLAGADLPSPEQRQQAAALVEECDRVTARLNQFLAFARPRQPQPTAVPLAALAAELATLLEPDLETKHLRIDASSVPADCRLQADRELLRQALFNMVGNAIEFAPEQGTIEIRWASGQDNRGRVEVADRGPGVPTEAVPSLFAPYFTTRPNGTGLGLAIVQQIALAHGWEVGYTPRPGGGAIFWLAVPRAA